ncbi:hypothetical protein SD78_4167 [Bacillus badius]|nr:hypothetical protein SD78_4167 [Bacillus badius]
MGCFNKKTTFPIKWNHSTEKMVLLAIRKIKHISDISAKKDQPSRPFLERSLSEKNIWNQTINPYMTRIYLLSNCLFICDII